MALSISVERWATRSSPERDMCLAPTQEGERRDTLRRVSMRRRCHARYSEETFFFRELVFAHRGVYERTLGSLFS